MKIIGAHLSIAKGIETVQKQMEILKCKGCSMFLKNQKRFYSTKMCPEKIKEFKEKIKNPEYVLPHGSYLINLANPETFEKSFECLLDDLERCNQLGISLYNLHPGSDVKKIGEDALKLISININKAHKKIPNVIVCIENMAGQGNVCGSKFEEINAIIEGIEDKTRIGVVLDTCHMFAAGYDIRTKSGFEEVIKEFDKIVGLKYLKGMHINDSKFDLGSKKDRHEHLGEGKIGLEAFKFIMQSHYFEDIPLILETPDPMKYEKDIQILYSFLK